MSSDEKPADLRPEVRWGLGCLVASLALGGVLILVLLIAIALRPPVWLQVVLGIGLVVGATLLAWVVAVALGGSGRRDG